MIWVIPDRSKNTFYPEYWYIGMGGGDTALTALPHSFILIICSERGTARDKRKLQGPGG